MRDRGDVSHHMADQHSTYNNYGGNNVANSGNSSASSTSGGGQANVNAGGKMPVQKETPKARPVEAAPATAKPAGTAGFDNADSGQIRGVQAGEEHGKEDRLGRGENRSNGSSDVDSDSDFI